ncbi:MAG: 23S rRNA (adenine(2030)-N(6))-methyltransferase RlmJ, partial [Lentisphaeria bacterium]
MYSYQHAYHAGNAADAAKHAILALVLARYTQKPAPLTYYETHAGRGLYPLTAPETARLREYRTGLLPLLETSDVPPGLHPWLALLRDTYENQNAYPGSPLTAAGLLRPQDTLHVCEGHPGEVRHLRQACKTDRRIHIHAQDGHRHILALLPPANQRGVLLIDPSYEVKTEYAQTVATVAAAQKKAPGLCTLVWYPLLAAGHHQSMVEGLKNFGIPSTFRLELHWPPAGEEGRGLRGTGLLLLNAPYR